jgi:hypothetical protein
MVLASCSTGAPRRNLIEEYRRVDFAPERDHPLLDDAYRERILLEFEIIRAGRIEPLREAMADPNRYVRSFAIAALGILGDQASVEAIARVLDDPEVDSMVGAAALQALGWLKGGLQAVQTAKVKSRTLNRHLLNIAERQITDPIDHASKVREAYKAGLRRDDVGIAKVGRPAPDFDAVDTDGLPFRLSDAVRKNNVVVLVFVAADW